MSNFFKEVVNDLDSVEQDLLGPDYQYWKQIKQPAQLGMYKSDNLSALASDVTAMVDYVELIIAGGGNASNYPGPLGDRFFLRTGAKCTDIASGKKVHRSIYVDNVPSGNIPFISGALGENFQMLEGILPGTIFGIANINPLAIFQAFMSGTDPSCQAITLPVRNVNNINSTQTEFLTNPDIKNISPCLFTTTKNPLTGQGMGDCNSGGAVGYLGGDVKDESGTGGTSGAVPSPSLTTAPTKQCNIKPGQSPSLKSTCTGLKDEKGCNASGICNWGEPESFQNRYPSQSYIGDCSEIIGYLYVGLMIILICYVLTKAAKKR